MSALAAAPVEAVERFACFGGTCTVLVSGTGPAGSAPDAARRVRRRLLQWHQQFSRFEETSELSLLNRDPRDRVPVSSMMVRFAEAAVRAAEMTGGLVDPTLLTEVERAGYDHDFARIARTARVPSRPAPLARPAEAHPAARWREVVIDRRAGTVTRPPGLRLDSGGIAKGLFGDVLASLLAWHHSYAIEAAGDLRFGGAGRISRAIQVQSPFARGVLHTFELSKGAAATSGTTKRSWIDDRGRVAHHLLNPVNGRPAFTGVIQATALAPSGVEAEALAKAALLSGREAATGWLPHGGVLVYDDGTHEVIEPRISEALR